jgi:hypothetical protein
VILDLCRIGGGVLRKNYVSRTNRGVFLAKLIIAAAFMLVGAMVAYGFLSRGGQDRSVDRTVPIIMPADLRGNTPDSGSSEASDDEAADAGESGGVPQAPDADQFDDGRARVSAYSVPSAALKKTVDKYAPNRANQCAGEIIVRTNDTPLNVRSGPAVSYGVLSKAEKGSRQSVLLTATDERQGFSGRWFLLVDDQEKTVKGWVSGEYCDAGAVVFPD